MARFFIDRPVFAWVIAILIMLAGVLSIMSLPIAQYPSIAPPTIGIVAQLSRRICTDAAGHRHAGDRAEDERH